ncbi:MAG: hypothetical protein AAGJ87_02685 [Pseudomonadota bacterium]
MKTLCADPVFRRQFAMTEGWHQSAACRMKRFKEWSEAFLVSIESELALMR